MFTVAAHNTPWVNAPVSPMTTGRNPDLHHRIFTVMDQTRKQILKIKNYRKEIKHNLQIYQMADQHPLKIWEGTSQTHTPEDNIQVHKVETNGKIIQIIEMVLFLTADYRYNQEQNWMSTDQI